MQKLRMFFITYKDTQNLAHGPATAAIMGQNAAIEGLESRSGGKNARKCGRRGTATAEIYNVYRTITQPSPSCRQ